MFQLLDLFYYILPASAAYRFPINLGSFFQTTRRHALVHRLRLLIVYPSRYWLPLA